MALTIVLHIGAGRHLPGLATHHKRLLSLAANEPGLAAVARAIEQSPLTNTGRGLTLDRTGQASLDCCLFTADHGRLTEQLAVLDISQEPCPTLAALAAADWLDAEFRRSGLAHLLGLLRPSCILYDRFLLYAFGCPGLAKLPPALMPGLLVLKRAWRDYQSFERCLRQKQDSEEPQKEAVPTTDLLASHLAGLSPTHPLETPSPHTLNASPAKTGNGRPTSPYRESLAGQTTPRAEASFQDQAADPLQLAEPLLATQRPPVEDTVGVLELTGSTIKGTTSSGGNFYRVPGRVSCAGLYGAGIAYASHNGVETVCMCLGNGDDIVRMQLAGQLCQQVALQLTPDLPWPDLGAVLVDAVLGRASQACLQAVDESLLQIVYVGVLMVVRCAGRTRLAFCHSTESFYFAFRLGGTTETVLSVASAGAGKFTHGEYKL